MTIGAERGDEDEQHRAGHEGLATGVGAEGEDVRGQHDEGGADRGQQRPAADVLDRCDGDLELIADQRQVGPHDVPRLACREDRGERRRIGQPGDRPGDGDDREQHGGEHGQPRAAQQERDSVADEHDQEDITEELPVAEHPDEAEGGDERVEGQAERRRGVEESALVAQLGDLGGHGATAAASAWSRRRLARATLPPAPASAAQASRKAVSERASTASRAWRAGSCMV